VEGVQRDGGREGGGGGLEEKEGRSRDGPVSSLLVSLATGFPRPLSRDGELDAERRRRTKTVGSGLRIVSETRMGGSHIDQVWTRIGLGEKERERERGGEGGREISA